MDNNSPNQFDFSCVFVCLALEKAAGIEAPYIFEDFCNYVEVEVLKPKFKDFIKNRELFDGNILEARPDGIYFIGREEGGEIQQWKIDKEFLANCHEPMKSKLIFAMTALAKKANKNV